MIVFININSPNDYSYQTGHVPCKRIRYSRDLDTQINNDIKSGNIKVEISRDHAEFLLLLFYFFLLLSCAANWHGILYRYTVCVYVEN